MLKTYLTINEILDYLDEPMKTNFLNEIDKQPNTLIDDVYIIRSEDNKIINVFYNKKFKFFNSNIKKIFTNNVHCCIIKENEILQKITIPEFIHRYSYNERTKNMKNSQDYELLINIDDEQESYTDDDLYNITSFGVDLSFREIIMMLNEGDLEKPDLQRNYVWTRNEASRFIDSILLGLPVPSIFLAKTNDGRRLIVDGFQRIMTVYDYIEKGVFSDGKIFKLSKSDNINHRWQGKAYSELTEEEKRTIRNATIHAIVFEQKSPQNDTGMYQIFERINTGGRVLKPQEIRNCIYHGKFNQLIKELNKNKTWRGILGYKNEDSRMSDVELILRFFAFNNIKTYLQNNSNTQINLMKYLNNYMGIQNTASDELLNKFQYTFENTISFLYNKIGKVVFHTLSKSKNNDNDDIKFNNKINPVVFDSVSVATTYVLENNKIDINAMDNLLSKYITLLKDVDYINVTKQRTTNIDNIKDRISIACKYLYGVDYEW